MINQNYLNKYNLEIIKKQFSKYKMIRLGFFIENKLYKKLKREIQKEKFEKKKIADKFSYSACSSAKSIKNIFNSDELKFVIESILNKKINKIKLEIKKFQHGNYTLMHDSNINKDNLKFYLFICNSWNPKWGGNKVYIKKEKSYVFSPNGNSFILIRNEKNSKNFIQYINHQARNNKLIILQGGFDLMPPTKIDIKS